MTYVGPTIDLDEEAVAQQAFSFLSSTLGGWVFRASAFEVALVYVAVRLAIEQRIVLSAVSEAVYQSFGQDVMGVPVEAAVAATSFVTFTLSANAATGGFTVPAGTAVGIAHSDGNLEEFATVVDLLIAAGASDGTVLARASLEGSQANALSGTGGLIDAVPSQGGVALSSISFAASSGGVDAETPMAYRDRLSQRSKVLAIHPVLAQDFADIAMLDPGVTRALAIDLYDPVANTYAHARTVAVILQGADGDEVDSDTLARVDATLQGLREVNFVVNTAQVARSLMPASVTVTKRSGWLDADVVANVRAAIAAWLDPLAWGGPQLHTDPAWRVLQVVRLNDLIAVARQADGVAYVESALLNGSAADQTLPNPYSVPYISTPAAVTVH